MGNDSSIKSVSTNDMIDLTIDVSNAEKFKIKKLGSNCDTETVSIDSEVECKKYNDGYWYNQQCNKYEKIPYSDDNLKKSGCGIFAFATLFNSFLSNEYQSPEAIATKAYENGVDTSKTRNAFNDLAKIYGLDEPEIIGGYENDCLGAYKPEIDKALDDGKKVIVHVQNEYGRDSGKKGYWTKGGHYIVLTGKTDDNKYIVIDSMSEERTKVPQDADKIFGFEEKMPYAYFAVIFSLTKADIKNGNTV